MARPHVMRKSDSILAPCGTPPNDERARSEVGVQSEGPFVEHVAVQVRTMAADSATQCAVRSCSIGAQTIVPIVPNLPAVPALQVSVRATPKAPAAPRSFARGFVAARAAQQPVGQASRRQRETAAAKPKASPCRPRTSYGVSSSESSDTREIDSEDLDDVRFMRRYKHMPVEAMSSHLRPRYEFLIRRNGKRYCGHKRCVVATRAAAMRCKVRCHTSVAVDVVSIPSLSRLGTFG
eukprot:TRINITY_DN16560_c0_g3_i1.p1 TRINITY_DN16560_c0_g3~~TRINITY_DN16560_c0_g3_i1.p1  ORF type:complete len:236 (-),score=29.66 TRINITY_DN16560_c0_g3_i1:287-994(-)